MKQFFFALALAASTAVPATAGMPERRPADFRSRQQQNLIGEVTAIDAAGGKLVILTETKASVTVSLNDKTAFRRVAPGETSLAKAETIRLADLKIGDRVLVPGGAAAATPVRQVIVMARTAIEARNTEAVENRRARTLGGRITAIDAQNKEIVVQTRGRAGGETVTVAAGGGGVKFLRFAPDSLKQSDAVAGSFAALRVGDQIRVVGDRSGARVTAEEIIAGAVTRLVGTISEINAARGELIVKNAQTGQLATVAIGKKTALRRITPEAAERLKQRFERRNERRAARANNADAASPTDRPRNRRADRDAQNARPQGQQFENMPAVTLAELKKGDAVLITATSADGAAAPITAVTVTTGAAELQEYWQRAGGNGNRNMSPGLPGNISGGNDAGDDEP
jgi:hypothetical protein